VGAEPRPSKRRFTQLPISWPSGQLSQCDHRASVFPSSLTGMTNTPPPTSSCSIEPSEPIIRLDPRVERTTDSPSGLQCIASGCSRSSIETRTSSVAMSRIASSFSRDVSDSLVTRTKALLLGLSAAASVDDSCRASSSITAEHSASPPPKGLRHARPFSNHQMSATLASIAPPRHPIVVAIGVVRCVGLRPKVGR